MSSCDGPPHRKMKMQRFAEAACVACEAATTSRLCGSANPRPPKPPRRSMSRRLIRRPFELPFANNEIMQSVPSQRHVSEGNCFDDTNGQLNQ
jgi:hypothetical protein